MAEIDGIGYVMPGMGPGRDIAEFGGKQAMGLILSMAQIIKTGDINPYLRNSVEEAPQISEGLTDGATIASKFGCNSNTFNAVVTQIETTMRSKAGKDHSSNDTLAFNALMSPTYRNQLALQLQESEALKISGFHAVQVRLRRPETCPCARSKQPAWRNP